MNFNFHKDNTSNATHGSLSFDQSINNVKIFDATTNTWSEVATYDSPKIITEDILLKTIENHTKLLFNFLKLKEINVDYTEFQDYLKSIEIANKLSKNE